MNADKSAMTLRAEISRGYLMRLGLVGMFCFLGGLYFFYDGMYGYPAKRERGIAFLKFQKENAEMDELERYEAWKKYAAEKGWPQDNPLDPDTKKPVSLIDINEQFYYGGGACLIGLGFLSRFAYMFHRWIECDETSVRDKAGHEARYADITELNKKKWQSKGIAFVKYRSEKGPQQIRLDDFYFQRDATRQILRKVEANIDPALITNGKPEPPETVVASEG